MKTWFNYWPVIMIVFILPIILTVLPTEKIKGAFLGGGPVREYIVNQAITFADSDRIDSVVSRFNSGVTGEIITTIPITILISIAVSWVFFFYLTIWMKLNNWFVKQAYLKQRSTLKGK